MPALLQVLVATPAHSRLSGPLVYESEQHLPPGTLVRVPLGSRDTLGLVWPGEPAAPPLAQIKPVHEALTDIAALDTHWLELMAFAAAYYQRSVGEFALGSLPPSLRDLSRQQLLRKLDKRAKAAAVIAPHNPDALLPELTAEQRDRKSVV